MWRIDNINRVMPIFGTYWCSVYVGLGCRRHLRSNTYTTARSQFGSCRRWQPTIYTYLLTHIQRVNEMALAWAQRPVPFFFINDWVLRFIQSKHNIETGLRYTYYRILFDMLYASMLLRCQRDSCLYKKIWKSVRDKKKADGNAGEIVQKQDLASIITKLTTYRLCLATGLRRACLGHSQIVNAIWAVVERRLANLRKHPYNVNVGHCHNKR